MPAKPLNQMSGMPQMKAAFAGWTTAMMLKRIRQSVNAEGYPIDAETLLNIRGVWQPLSTNQINLKPEGQRSWSWYMLHIEGRPAIETNDRVVYAGVKYKVMGKKDYSLNNYVELHLALDYQASAS